MNSCLQAILITLDNITDINTSGSQLWELLLWLKNHTSFTPIDSTPIKDLLYYKEKQRIIYNNVDPHYRLFHFFSTTATTFEELDFETNTGGQQDCKDFFVCIGESKEHWQDVFDLFKFSLKAFTVCTNCSGQSYSGASSEQMFVHLRAPMEPVSLNQLVSAKLEQPTTVQGWRHENGCEMITTGQNYTQISNIREIKFLLVIIERLDRLDGHDQINNCATPIDDLMILHDSDGIAATFQPIAVIHHAGGVVTATNDTMGHYMTDIFNTEALQWYRTSDDEEPFPLDKPADNGYVVIYKRCMEDYLN